MLKMLSFQPPKCSSGLLMARKDKKGKKKELTLWINPAEWMYCSTGGVAGVQGRREREDGGQQCSSEFNFLPRGCFCLSESEEPAGLIQC